MYFYRTDTFVSLAYYGIIITYKKMKILYLKDTFV